MGTLEALLIYTHIHVIYILYTTHIHLIYTLYTPDIHLCTPIYILYAPYIHPYTPFIESYTPIFTWVVSKPRFFVDFFAFPARIRREMTKFCVFLTTGKARR